MIQDGVQEINVCKVTCFTPSCTGEEFLQNQGVDYSTWGFWQNHLALGVMTICFLTIAYLKLRFIRKFT